mgnify:CR=1 FL=1
MQKEAALAAKRSIVTVEEIVNELDASVNACVLPSWAITAISHVPLGAKPSYALGYYERDNSFYKQWDGISRDRASFQAWVQENIFVTPHISAPSFPDDTAAIFVRNYNRFVKGQTLEFQIDFAKGY